MMEKIFRVQFFTSTHAAATWRHTLLKVWKGFSFHLFVCFTLWSKQGHRSWPLLPHQSSIINHPASRGIATWMIWLTKRPSLTDTLHVRACVRAYGRAQDQSVNSRVRRSSASGSYNNQIPETSVALHYCLSWLAHGAEWLNLNFLE